VSPAPAARSGRRHPSRVPAPEARFAHPSEEIFASLLSLYGVAWEYEPVEFALAWDDAGRPTRAFRPDFYLPDHDTFVELTVLAQRLVTRKNRKVREFRALYPETRLLVLYQRDFVTLLERHALASGTPRRVA
jgi:hypothetical protein